MATTQGTAGNDTLVSDVEADVLNGLEGIDTADYSASNAGITKIGRAHV